MITRHFYESVDVIKALRRAILLQRSKEAAFWCQELIDSSEEELAYECLFETWLVFINFMNATWYEKARTNIPLQELCYNLCLQKEYDASTLGIIILQGEPTDRISGKGNIMTLQDYFEVAVHQGRTRSAWWAAKQLGTHILKTPVKNTLWFCGHIVFQSNKKRNIEWQEIPMPIQKQLDIWKIKTGRRSRRELSIPFKNLLPKERIYNIEKTIYEDGCAFWKEALQISGYTHTIWSSDNALEAFYKTYFPDDIPDEWSKQEQDKSHSLCQDIRNDTYTLGRWLRIWMPSGILMRSVWGYESLILEKISEIVWSDDILKTLDTIPLWLSPDMKKQLTGCKYTYTIDTYTIDIEEAHK